MCSCVVTPGASIARFSNVGFELDTSVEGFVTLSLKMYVCTMLLRRECTNTHDSDSASIAVPSDNHSSLPFSASICTLILRVRSSAPL
jgi:hypothetical protein